MTLAITIDLDRFKQLMMEFVHEREHTEGMELKHVDLMRRLTLSDFLLWLRNKQEQGCGSGNADV